MPLFGFDVPETGDESWTGLWAALCLTGLGGAAAAASGPSSSRGRAANSSRKRSSFSHSVRLSDEDETA